MKIERIDVLVLQLELKFPFVTSHAELTRKKTILVRVAEASGVVGYGEAPVFDRPWYLADYVASEVDVLVRFLGPSLIGQEVSTVAEAISGMRNVVGHNAAKAGLEAALWHVQSLLGDEPLAQLWGEPSAAVDVGISLGAERDINVLTNRVEAAVAQGYRRIKLKILPGWDVIPLRAIRKRFPNIPLSVDANGAYESSNDGPWTEVDDLALTMIEQPFPADDLTGHARLQNGIRTSVCLDESINSPGRAADAIALGACQVVTVKPSSVGGFAAALEISQLCRDHGIDSWVGGMLETGIGKAFAVHLAATGHFTMPADIAATDRYFDRDVLSDPIVVRNGRISIPRSPGLGWTVDEPSIAALTVESFVIK